MLTDRTEREAGLIGSIAQHQNQDLLVFDADTSAIRLSSDGDVKGRGRFVVPVRPTRGVMKVVRSISNCGDPVIATFNEKLEPVRTINAKSEGLCRRLVFELDEGALAIFGEQVRAMSPRRRSVGSIRFKVVQNLSCFSPLTAHHGRTSRSRPESPVNSSQSAILSLGCITRSVAPMRVAAVCY
jgi:hypothetical protein